VVGWVDLCSPDAHAAAKDLARDRKLVGLRHIAQSEPDDFLLRPDFQRGISTLADLGLAYDILIYARQLPAALELVRAFPGQRFVIDHIAKPEIKAGVQQPWKDQMREMSRHPNVTCKLSGMVTEADWHLWQPSDLTFYLDTALDCFGPSRLMIASDWPVCLLAGSYERVVAVVLDYITRLSPDEQAAILGGTAGAVYRLVAADRGNAGCGIKRSDVVITCSGCHSRYDVTGRRAGSRARCRCGTVVSIPKLSDSAEMLHCPGCGAPSSPEGVSCPYCQAVLAVVACPSCFGRVFAGSQHCQHCGAEMLIAAQGDPETASHRKCPRCTVDPSKHASTDKSPELLAHLLGETLLDECGACGGVWLEAAAFEKLIKSRDEQAVVVSGSGPYLEIEAFSQRTGALETPRYLPCPDCGQLMNRKNFADSSGVIVDVCKAHGLWFDRDELGRIIQFVTKGGLVESRRRELELLAHNLKEKRAEMSGLGGPTGMMTGGPTRYEGEWLTDVIRLFRDFLR